MRTLEFDVYTNLGFSELVAILYYIIRTADVCNLLYNNEYAALNTLLLLLTIVVICIKYKLDKNIN